MPERAFVDVRTVHVPYLHSVPKFGNFSSSSLFLTVKFYGQANLSIAMGNFLLELLSESTVKPVTGR
jgi:hypothetical protein